MLGLHPGWRNGLGATRLPEPQVLRGREEKALVGFIQFPSTFQSLLAEVKMASPL
jgi:hypothetical protein